GTILQAPVVAELPLNLAPRLQLTSDPLTSLPALNTTLSSSARRLYNREDADDHVVPVASSTCTEEQREPNSEGVGNVLSTASAEQSERLIQEAWRSLAAEGLLATELLSHSSPRL
ncbi:hypothetical protein Tcan_00583, partial [Toxocara canis]